jgi:hypothetical protein
VDSVLVKSFGELNTAALRRGMDRELAVFLLGKALDANRIGQRRGCTRIRPRALLRIIRSHRWFVWGGKPMSGARFEKIVARGDATFWHTGKARSVGQYLYLHSWDRICRALDVEPWSVLEMPLEAFRSLHAFRAWCYGSEIPYERTISRAFLSAQTGKTKQTQCEYDKIVGTRKQANIGRHVCGSHQEAVKFLRWLNEDDGSGPKRKRGYMGWDGLSIFVWMPSTLCVDWRFLPGGRAKRIRDQMQADFLVQSSESSGESCLSASARRRYCETDQQARRLYKRDALGAEYFVKTGQTLGKNRVWGYFHAFQDLQRGCGEYALAA